MTTLSISSSRRTEFVDITSEIEEIVKKDGWKSGLLCIYLPHTTAGITINENADPSVQQDILNSLNKIVPHAGNYRHTEGNADAHIKASIIGSSVVCIVENSRLVLGRWQGIFLCEFDGPRRREIYLKFATTSLTG
ncbi:MAG: secondary thiamine-phosphate synthase enzyme YjbQ [Planctomycetota bacterium]|nr:secondary thiamine-phosphate synthase enzyme YjbQ [Planctomycetota bacterium]MDI6788848.1 secondary thiamine-phosphate synthase enzyme YjbQ [Planctomycetota bacterium]